ncbi:MAG: hypothetical protein EGR33_01515 [Prevotella sp.]|nr:hypothetical protein [Prevotella sp.]
MIPMSYALVSNAFYLTTKVSIICGFPFIQRAKCEKILDLSALRIQTNDNGKDVLTTFPTFFVPLRK